MTAANSGNRTLKLIEGRPMDALRGTEGGRSAAAKDKEAMDLARDMALMYRAALLRDLPCDKRPASSSCVRLDENTDIPVRDLDDAVAQFNSNEPKAAHDKHDTRFSCFLTLGVPITRGSIGTTRACPGPDAAMSRWVEWLDDVFGLNIPFLADPAQFEDMSTPGALSACVHRSDPAKLPFQAALTLLALGVPIHPNLSGGSAAGPDLSCYGC